MSTLVTGTHGRIDAWALKTLVDAGDTPVPVVGVFDDGASQRDLGPLPATPLASGVRGTIERSERLHLAGRLDAPELS